MGYETRIRTTTEERGAFIALRLLDAVSTLGWAESPEALRHAVPLLKGFREECDAEDDAPEVIVWDALIALCDETATEAERRRGMAS